MSILEGEKVQYEALDPLFFNLSNAATRSMCSTIILSPIGR
jgi:hypothetical protein